MQERGNRFIFRSTRIDDNGCNAEQMPDIGNFRALAFLRLVRLRSV